MKNVLCVIGTRPEAIKMAPVIKRLENDPDFRMVVCATGQHKEMLKHVLSLFELEPDFYLDVMRPNQSLTSVTCSILEAMENTLLEVQPDFVLVQGDTTTTMAAALAAFYQKIRVGHVEAGLRTGDMYAPWPEELNRKIAGIISCLHFAPTDKAKASLLAEGVDEAHIHVTGNTVIDALLSMVDLIERDTRYQEEMLSRFPFLLRTEKDGGDKRLILVTGHRRESFGRGFENIIAALNELSGRQDVEIVYPVHLNPNVSGPVRDALAGRDNVHLIDPVDYREFVFMMIRSYCILTDSGGVQEEGPAIGKPVLVMRDKTERGEAVDEGVVKLVGANKENIVRETIRLLDDEAAYLKMSQRSLCYGDGHASERIHDVLKNF